MPLAPRRRRHRIWIAALSLTGLLLGPSRALAVRREAEVDPQRISLDLAGVISDERSPLIPVDWPFSHRLLAVTDGRWPGDPFDGPDVCGSAIHIPEYKGFELIPVVRGPLDEDLVHLVTMRELATAANDGTLNTVARARLDSAFQAEIAAIDELAHTTLFYGIAVLDGSVDMCVDGVPVHIDLPDLTDYGLGLTGASFDVTTVTNALQALVTVDQAIGAVTVHRAEIDRDEIALLEGPADGGLPEQQRVLQRMQGLAVQALDGTLNQAQRAALELAYQEDLTRVGDVARNMHFLTVPLLDGTTDVALQGAPPAFRRHTFDLPNTTAAALGIADTCLDTYADTLAALAALDQAYVTILEQRQRVGDAVDDLMGS